MDAQAKTYNIHLHVMKMSKQMGECEARKRALFPSVRLNYLPVLLSSRCKLYLVQMLVFHVRLEHFHTLSNALLLVGNGGGWALSACQTLELVYSKEKLRRVWLALVLVGFLTSHIGHVVVCEMCRNYIEDCPKSKPAAEQTTPSSPTCLRQQKKSHG